MRNQLFLFLLLGCILSMSAQPGQALWQDLEASRPAMAERANKPSSARFLGLEIESMRSVLAQAPLEFTQEAGLQIVLPTPTGGFETFSLQETQIIPDNISARYPLIKAYRGNGVANPTHRIRLTLGYTGLNATVFASEETYVVEPLTAKNPTQYQSYFVSDLPSEDEGSVCGMDPTHFPELAGSHDTSHEHEEGNDDDHSAARNGSGADLYVYNIAFAADYLYSNYVASGSVDTATVLTVLTNLLNNINGVYEQEVAIRFIMNANQTQMIFLDAATDPYTTNGQPLGMIDEAPPIFNARIGINNFDIGHNLTVGPPFGVLGVGRFQSVCANGPGTSDQVPVHKSNGASGTTNPLSFFFFATVLHEIGHQFDAKHIFNYCTGAVPVGTPFWSPYEPGSGSSIMSYSGICGGGNDIQGQPDAYFHVANYDEIFAFSRNGTGCVDIFPTGNTPPTVDATQPGNAIIPISTPFELTASGSDVDGDTLTYCWEQYDQGPSAPLGTVSGNAPLFRSVAPTENPTRVFPTMQTILNGSSSNNEILPSYGRNMTFRASVRDNNFNAGGLRYDEISLTVFPQAGPFVVSFPNGGEFFTEGEVIEITWDPSNTQLAPINCSHVDIILSTNGGLTFSDTLLKNTPNDGSELIFAPNAVGTSNLIKIKSRDNVFFDISDDPFFVNAASAPDISLLVPAGSATLCPTTSTTFDLLTVGQGGYTGSINVVVGGLPAGVSFSTSPANPVAGDTVQITLTGDATAQTGSSSAAIVVTTPTGNPTEITNVDVNVLDGAPAAINIIPLPNGGYDQSLTPSFNWIQDPEANTYLIEVSSSPDFSTIEFVQSGILGTSATILTPLLAGEVYYWRVAGQNDCGNGPYSPTFAFQTGNCTVYQAEDVPAVIPPFGNPATAISSIVVPATGAGTIRDLNVVGLQGNHMDVGQISVILQRSGVPTRRLFGGVCEGDMDFNLSFDDQAPAGPILCPPTDGSAYQPADALSVFNGTNSAGQYILTVRDSINFDDGQLTGWGLEICLDGAPIPSVSKNDTLYVSQSATGTIDNNLLEVSSSVQGTLTYTLISLPAHGELQLNGTPLAVGGTFNQADINANTLTYVHGGSSDEFDFFTFSTQNAQGGWSGMRVFNIRITDIVSIERVDQQPIRVYPNPARSQVTIDLGVYESAAEVSLYTQQGQLVQQQPLTSTLTNLNLEGLASGLYLIRIQIGSTTHQTKLVIE